MTWYMMALTMMMQILLLRQFQIGTGLLLMNPDVAPCVTNLTVVHFQDAISVATTPASTMVVAAASATPTALVPMS